jgi:hypothetical protein
VPPTDGVGETEMVSGPAIAMNKETAQNEIPQGSESYTHKNAAPITGPDTDVPSIPVRVIKNYE